MARAERGKGDAFLGFDQAVNALAQRAGALHGELVDTALREYAADEGDLNRLALRMHADLEKGQLVGSKSRQILDDIVGALSDDTTVAAAEKRIRTLVRQLDELEEHSLVATVIGHIGLDSIQTVAKEKDEGGKGVGLADAAGAATGAQAGMGAGFLGALIGGFAVGIAFSVIAKRDSKKS